MLLFIAAYLVVVLSFVGRQSGAVLCDGMEVIIRDSLERGLVTRADVLNLVRLEHPEVAGMPLSGIDMPGIEESLNQFPAIYDAQVYTRVHGKLVIELSQRNPIVRIEDRRHKHYYIDGEGFVIPANLDYAPHVLHINGHIPEKFGKMDNVSAEGGGGLMKDVHRMAGIIHGDPFWFSQIVQVYVNRDAEFELIPRVGSQIILFGTGENMENKFFKLKTLYNEGFSHTGWNQYGTINLKYKNQVICTKR